MKIAWLLSSSIQKIAYDSIAQELYVYFHSGSLYRYFGVPESIFEGFLMAKSKGAYFTHSVRNFYDYEEIRLAA